jgi:predicted DsbA family dithiol-disulfide isomerase
VRIDIWSDVVCPWCYVGKRNLERALADFEHRDEVDVHWHAYELDPNAPPEREGPYAERLARKYRATPEQVEAMINRMVQAGAEAGVELRFDRSRAGNTFDAHRLLRFAAEFGPKVQGALKERLLQATFTEGEPIGDRETLVRLAADAGLDKNDARAVLDSDQYAADVRADEQLAHELDVTGVPFFVFDRTYALPGAQPPDVFAKVLDRAWSQREAAAGVAAGEVCDDDNCAI